MDQKVLCCFILMSVGFTTATALCYENGYFKANGTYQQNRDLFISSLASNVTAQGGYYNVTLGQEPDIIYAMALCRGDYIIEDCQNCINYIGQKIIADCPNDTEVYSWGGDTLCFLRYSNRSFFGSMSLYPDVIFYNVNDINYFNMTQFNRTWEDLMVNALTRASAGSSRLKYAVEIAKLSTFVPIYVLMICTPDISPSQCNNCLTESVSAFKRYYYGKQGGGTHRPSCFFRWDMYQFANAFDNIQPLPPPPLPFSSPPFGDPKSTTRTTKKGSGSVKTIVTITVPAIIIFMAIAALSYAILWRRKSYQKRENELDSSQSLRFDFATIRDSTRDFSIENKLGQGGFGTVYQGKLPDGQDIAVKRLSGGSRQGEREFRNEVLLVAKLQHRNLAKLLGFCFEGDERLLIYEFAPNSSLDSIISDPAKPNLVDWQSRYKIIEGIARGLLYLHEDSRLKIIHLDLKASNILLDAKMNPKISDFGMAKLFALDESQAEASRIVGTIGYMAPEYLNNGHISVKCDVYSFGVLVLEIVAGQINNHFRVGGQLEVLVAYAWKLWREGTPVDLIDPTIGDYSRNEVIRCIHIGLLCVQEHMAQRPEMGSVVVWLSSQSVSLPVPACPAYILMSSSGKNNESDDISYNAGPITKLDPR